MENYEEIMVTEDNIKEIRQEINCDQADDVMIGDVISTYGIFYQPGGQRGQLTIIHSRDGEEVNRGGIHFGADSDWGDWDPDTQLLTFDDTDGNPAVYDINGELVELEAEPDYTLWDRTTDQGEDITAEQAAEIMRSADMCTGPYGCWGSNIDLVLYSQTGDDDPVVEAVRHRGEWVTIPDSQDAFMSHELSTTGYDPDPVEED